MVSRKPNPVDIQIGLNLRHLREARGISRRELGANLTPPVVEQSVDHYERGRNRMSGSVMVQCMQLLDADIGELFTGVKEVWDGKPLLVIQPADLKTTHLLKNYQQLPERMQDIMRELVTAVVQETATKLTPFKRGQ